MQIGDKVVKILPSDGHGYKQSRKPLTITNIENHKPIDGRMVRNIITTLSDGSWSFVWNIKKI